MKELTLHEVLEIAGGLPDQAALDELSYGVPASPLAPAPEAARSAAPPVRIE